ncbi:MAG TPA: glucose-1-phosphate thymidylyltransferase [Candidatus Thalassarchaeaceae archaeon]|nr:MAG TPA: glucose-1-phosphate thymidylyltransferase [Candidatus Poseidoniales archaeon]HIH85041.1 glucose-1-phosphate thymidylyltransferase [Candidatus Thalassarchaeaceae archaeon]|tara:strand:- start:74 stop:745 length:672 start_codon:yes stop_codon:yes gene_type:complete
MRGADVSDLFPSLSNAEDAPNFPKGPVWEILNPSSNFSLKTQLDEMVENKKVNFERYKKDGLAILIHNSAKVGKGVVIEGPTYIGPNVVIRPGAYIRPYSWICDGSVVGHCSEVKHSILLPNSKAPHFNYVGDSILGSGVNIGAGCKLSNLRNDGRNILIRDGETGELLEDSGLRKFGAILGEGVQLGCNVVTNPGTIMGKESGAWPNVTVSGLIKSGQTVKE